jgi:hypothetical protein
LDVVVAVDNAAVSFARVYGVEAVSKAVDIVSAVILSGVGECCDVGESVVVGTDGEEVIVRVAVTLSDVDDDCGSFGTVVEVACSAVRCVVTPLEASADAGDWMIETVSSLFAHKAVVTSTDIVVSELLVIAVVKTDCNVTV